MDSMIARISPSLLPKWYEIADLETSASVATVWTERAVMPRDRTIWRATARILSCGDSPRSAESITDILTFRVNRVAAQPAHPAVTTGNTVL